MTTGNDRFTLVLGGTGKTGRRIVERLEAQGVPVRVGSRNAAVPFDWDERSSWAPVLHDVDAAYIAYYPDLALPQAFEAIDAFVTQAVAAGVGRLVLLSGRGEDGAERCERRVRESGIDWTILRCSWFNQNFSENYLLDGVLAGELVLPVDAVREPFVDAEDIAEIATAALTDQRHVGQLYEITGPRLLSFAEAVAEIAHASGRTVRLRAVSMAEYTAMLTQMDVPGEFVTLLTYLFTEVLDGRNASLADGVQRALGRQPRDFAEFARRTAASGLWNAPDTGQ